MELKGSLPRLLLLLRSVYTHHSVRTIPVYGLRVGPLDVHWPSGENGGAPGTAKMELKSSQSTVFNILTFYEVMDVCFKWNSNVGLGLNTQDHSEALLVLTYRPPDDRNLGVPKHVRKTTVYPMCLLFSEWQVG